MAGILGRLPATDASDTCSCSLSDACRTSSWQSLRKRFRKSPQGAGWQIWLPVCVRIRFYFSSGQWCNYWNGTFPLWRSQKLFWMLPGIRWKWEFRVAAAWWRGSGSLYPYRRTGESGHSGWRQWEIQPWIRDCGKKNPDPGLCTSSSEGNRILHHQHSI